MPALARGGHSGGHSGARGAQHSHARPGGSAPLRYFSGRPRVGFFLGAPVFASPWFYPAPVQLAPMPPIEYIEKPPEASLYFCPEANGYYPLVWQCPSGWEQAQAPAAAPSLPPYSAGAPDPANPNY
jgi:hypothetical protein